MLLGSILVFELVKHLLNAPDTAAGGTTADETDDENGKADDVLIVGDDGDSLEPPDVGSTGIFSLGRLLVKLNSVTFPSAVDATDIADECDSEDGKSCFLQDSEVNAPESLFPIVELVAIVILLIAIGISLDLIGNEGFSVLEKEGIEDF